MPSFVCCSSFSLTTGSCEGGAIDAARALEFCPCSHGEDAQQAIRGSERYLSPSDALREALDGFTNSLWPIVPQPRSIQILLPRFIKRTTPRARTCLPGCRWLISPETGRLFYFIGGINFVRGPLARPPGGQVVFQTVVVW